MERIVPPPRNWEKVKLSGGPSDIPIVHTLYDAYALWHQIVLKFPKSERYTVGETCSKHLLSALELLLAAAMLTNPAEKAARLRGASAKIDLLKLLVRLAKDCKCLSNTQYLSMESKLREAGKMLGGWLKAI